MRVMFSTTTGVFIFTDMRNKLRATGTKNTMFLDTDLICNQSQYLEKHRGGKIAEPNHDCSTIHLLSNPNNIVAGCSKCSFKQTMEKEADNEKFPVKTELTSLLPGQFGSF